MADDLSANWLAGAAQGFEPMRNNNFRVEFANIEGTDVILRGHEQFNLPSESNDEIEVHYLNEKRYIAGKVTFDTTSLTCKDFVTENVMKAIVQWRKRVYDSKTGKIFAASNYKREGTLAIFGPDGGSERKWRLIGAWPQAVNYGSLDMSSSDLLRIEVTIRFDKAEFQL